MRRFLKVLILLSILSCEGKKESEWVFLETNREVKFVNTPIFLNGFYIGLAFSKKSYNDHNVVGFRGVERLGLSKDSKFILSEDSLGQQVIIVEKGVSSDFIISGEKYPMTFLEVGGEFPLSRNDLNDSIDSELAAYIMRLLDSISR